jgi:hypothetical protein
MKVIIYNQNQGVYLVDSKNLSHVDNWKYNRPCEPNRVHEIKGYIEETGNVDGIIYMYETMINNNYKYFCYDGNHRLQALKELRQSYPVLINVYKISGTPEEIKEKITEKFMKLNLANPVPELYFDDDTKTLILKNVVDDAIKYLINKYPKHLTTSPNPRKPNFNRDNTTDKLYKYLSDSGKTNITKEYLIKEFERINQYCKNNITTLKNISKSALDKAKETNGYIFLIDFYTEITL